jgi:hypothetical protein
MSSNKERERKRQERRSRHSERRGGGYTPRKDVQVQEELPDQRDSDEVLENTLKVAAEMSEIGTQVASTLEVQTEQMLRIDRDLGEINASLQISERILKGMQSWTASLAKSWTSFVPEVPKLFGKSRADVSAQARDKEIKDGLGAIPNDDRDVFYVPKALVQDEGELAKLVKQLEEKKRWIRKPDEKLIYFYFNSASLKLLSMDTTANCILVSNRRIVKLEKGAEICSHDFIDIAIVDREDAAPGRYEKLIFTLRGGSRAVVGIWNKEVTCFFEKCLRKISEGNDINLELVKQKKGSDSKQAVQVKSSRGQTNHVEHLTKLAGDRPLTGSEEAYIQREAAKRDKQDKQLDVLNDILDDVLEKGKSIKSELEYQDKILDHLDTRVTDTTGRIQASNKKIDNLLR